MGFLFWLCAPVRSSGLLPPASCLVPTHTQPHNLLTHKSYTHTTYSHTSHTHATYSHTSHTHATYSHTSYKHTTYSHATHTNTTYSHTAHINTIPSHTTLSHTHKPSLCMAGVALGDIDLHFVWQARHLWHWAGSGGALGSRLSPWTPRLFVWQKWHLEASASILCGRRVTWQHRPSLCAAGVALMALGWLWWRTWFPFVAVGAAAVCLAGLAFGSIGLHSVWQAWRLATSTFTLYGMRGTYGTGLALVARLVPVCRRGRRGGLCGRRGIWKHRPPFRPSLCVAGVTLMALGWLWWRAWFPFVGSRGAWQYRLPLCMAGHLATSTFTLCGRRGTYGTGLALVARLVSVCRHCRRGGLCGRRGIWKHRPPFCLASVALGDIDLHFVWQA